jgi:hypothetical protein
MGLWMGPIPTSAQRLGEPGQGLGRADAVRPAVTGSDQRDLLITKRPQRAENPRQQDTPATNTLKHEDEPDR